MNIEQFRTLTGLIGEIRDRLPAPEITTKDPEPTKRPIPVSSVTQADRLTRGRREALAAVLSVLDGWIEGARENHYAMEHRGENRGGECWRQFAPDDFRRMINDAARQVGIREFDYPGAPREDIV